MSTAAQFLRRVSSSKRGCGPCPLPKGTGGATAPICATKAKLVILEARIFAMTPIETSQSSSLAGTLTPEALFLSGFDPETVHPENVRTAGVCGFSGVVDDAACLSCFFFRPSESLETRNQLFQRKLAFRQLRPQRPHIAFRCPDGKGCHPSQKNRTQRPTRGRFFQMSIRASAAEYSLFTVA